MRNNIEYGILQGEEEKKDTMEVDKGGDEEDGGDATVAEIPTKVIDTDLRVAVNCAVLYLDMEGRSDARSIKMILQHMAPLQLVLVSKKEKI